MAIASLAQAGASYCSAGGTRSPRLPPGSRVLPRFMQKISGGGPLNARALAKKEGPKRQSTLLAFPKRTDVDPSTLFDARRAARGLERRPAGWRSGAWRLPKSSAIAHGRKACYIAAAIWTEGPRPMPTPSETLHSIKAAALINVNALNSVHDQLEAQLVFVGGWLQSVGKGLLLDQARRVLSEYDEAVIKVARLASEADAMLQLLGTGGDPDPTLAPNNWSTGAW